MVINFFGNGCFRLQSGETSILLNPENNRLKADIVLRTITPTDVEPASDNSETPTIAFPGEYEGKGIEIFGLPIVAESREKFLKNAYVVTWEEMKLVFLGHLSTPIDASMAEEFGDPDIL